MTNRRFSHYYLVFNPHTAEGLHEALLPLGSRDEVLGLSTLIGVGGEGTSESLEEVVWRDVGHLLTTAACRKKRSSLENSGRLSLVRLQQTSLCIHPRRRASYGYSRHEGHSVVKRGCLQLGKTTDTNTN